MASPTRSGPVATLLGCGAATAFILTVLGSTMVSCLGMVALTQGALPAPLPPGIFEATDGTHVRWGDAIDPLRIAALPFSFGVSVAVMYGVQLAIAWLASRWRADAEPLDLYEEVQRLAGRPKGWLLLAGASMGPLLALDGGLHDAYAATLTTDGAVLHMPLRDVSGTSLHTWTDDGGLNLELDGWTYRVVVSDDPTRERMAQALGER